MSHYGLVALSLLAQGPLAALGEGVLNIPKINGLEPPVPNHTVSDASLELTVQEVLEGLPTVNEFQPEFANSETQVNETQVKQSFESEETLFSPSPILPVQFPTPAYWRPVSGMQLYQQRLTALKAGQIYTRLPADSFAQYWSKAANHPTHQQWQWLLELEAKAIASGQGSNSLNVLVGDSLSVWFPHDQLPQGKLWLNQSVSGEATRHIVKRLAFLKPTQPDRIFVLAGINDLRQGVTDEMIIQNWRTIVQTLRQQHPHSDIVLQSLLPTRLAAIPNERIRYLNSYLEAIARQEGATYLDLHHLFTNEQGNLRRALTTDGVHLSDRGYGIWQQALQKYEAPQLFDRHAFQQL